MSSRVAGMVCLLLGVGITWVVWHSALTENDYDLYWAVIGPLIIPLGIGALIHGERLPRTRITPLSRMYAILGAIAVVLNLHLLGADKDMPGMLLEGGIGLGLVFVFLLPAHMLRSDIPPRVPPKPKPQVGVSNEPIEPR